MSDVDELWARIDDARTRLGQVDQAQIHQAEDLSKRLKQIRSGLARRHEEVERRRAEADRLRHENEQLRRMLHRLLLSIEERYSGRLKTALQEIAEQVGGLMEIADAETDTAADEADVVEPEDTEAELPRDTVVAPVATAAAGEPEADPAPEAPRQPGEPTALPDEDDSVWLKQIMERARELTAEAGSGREAPARVPSPNEPSKLSRSAVA